MYEPSSETVYSDGCAQNILLPTQILFYGIPSIMFIRWECSSITAYDNDNDDDDDAAWCLPSLCPPACPRLRGDARLQCARTPGRRISTGGGQLCTQLYNFLTLQLYKYNCTVWGLRRSSPRTRPATARDTAPAGAPALPSTLLTTCPTTRGRDTA